MSHVSWWYGMTIPDGGPHGKTLMDGRRIVPKFYVEVRAYLNPHPNGDPLSAWAQAEAWFKEWVIHNIAGLSIQFGYPKKMEFDISHPPDNRSE